MSIFSVKSVKGALPLSLQHMLAMFVGTIVPPLLIANIVGLDSASSTSLIQGALFVSGISILLQIFPIKLFNGYRIGSNLPLMMGMNYVFLGISLSVGKDYGLGTLFGGLFAASFFGIFIGFFSEKIKKFFTPLISGVLVTCMGVGLFQPAIHNLAGGLGTPHYGEPRNFLVGGVVAISIVLLSKFGRGKAKDLAILIGIVIGYILALILGMVDFSTLKGLKLFALPGAFSYGIEFNPKVIFVFMLAYIVATIDFMGCCTVTTLGGLDRDLEGREFTNGVIGLGVGSLLGGIFGSIPVAGLTQNAAIISMTKKIDKVIFAVSSIMILLTSVSPLLAGVFLTIPNTVIGGATLVVFGMIAMSGIMLLTIGGFTDEKKLIAGISIATSVGISSVPGILIKFPEVVRTVVEGSSIITGVLIALILENLFKCVKLYIEKKEAKGPKSLYTEEAN